MEFQSYTLYKQYLNYRQNMDDHARSHYERYQESRGARGRGRHWPAGARPPHSPREQEDFATNVTAIDRMIAVGAAVDATGLTTMAETTKEEETKAETTKELGDEGEGGDEETKAETTKEEEETTKEEEETTKAETTREETTKAETTKEFTLAQFAKNVGEIFEMMHKRCDECLVKDNG